MIQPIKTIDAKCKDCHRCIRACPVKAISLRHGQAQVVYDRCIACGLCVSACPQKAKTVNSRVEEVYSWLQSGKKVVVSLAPSFPAAFTELEPLQVLAGLEAVGFAAVEETAAAALDVAQHYHKLFGNSTTPTISSCCPVVVNLIEMYYPQLAPLLASSVSPMIWHSHLLHQTHGSNAKIVFIGPCAGKIQEATRVPSHVDAVITFRQLRKLWQSLELDVASLLPAKLRPRLDIPRLYPLSRGILSSSALPGDTTEDIISVSGIETCMATFRDMCRGVVKPRFVEALACREGCIGGTGMPCGAGLMTRRAAVVKYHQACAKSVEPPAELIAHQPLEIPSIIYASRLPDYQQPTEEEIESILRQIGKHEPGDQRNCGGCGYATCRDKAVATYQGLAELEMCVPYMKAKFESLSHLVVESSMDGVVVVNKDMTIHQLNPSAQRMFNPCGLPTAGKNLADFIDPSNFMYVASSGSVFHRRVDYPNLELVTSQVIYSLPEYSLIVGIITDVTEEENRKKRLDEKHQATIQRATAVIKNQMKLAQEIASLLGESTAETKSTLLDLIATLTDDGDNA